MTPTEKAAVMVQGKGRKQEFVVPMPQSVVLPKQASNDVVTQAKPLSLNQKWCLMVIVILYCIPQVMACKFGSSLGQAIKPLILIVTDRNQSLGLYFLEVVKDNKKQAYLLKLNANKYQ
jgi:hypothetical protein